MHEMTITTEDAKGEFKTQRTICTTEKLDQTRAHYRTLVERGCTQTIMVKALTR